MQPQNNDPQGKADRVYYQSHQGLACDHLGQAIINLLRSVLFVVLLPVNIHSLETRDSLLMACLAVGLACSFLGFVVYLVTYVSLFRDVELYLSMAQVTSHAIVD